MLARDILVGGCGTGLAYSVSFSVAPTSSPAAATAVWLSAYELPFLSGYPILDFFLRDD